MQHDLKKTASNRFLDLLRPIERDLEVYCRRLVYVADDVPEAIQNTVLRAFRAFDRYHEDASFRGWMFRILTNEVFTLNRQRRRLGRHEVRVAPEILADHPAGEEPMELPILPTWERLADVLDDDLLSALQGLNQLERAVLLLRAIGGLRYREIGESLNIPLGSVMGTLYRARRKMRTAVLTVREGVRP